MKKIEAVIRIERLQAVREALEKADYPGMTITRAEGHGKQKGVVEQFRGREYKIDLLPKMKVEIVARDQDVERIVSAIIGAAQTGKIGDGKIFVCPIEEVIRIRTGERGEEAI